MPKKTAEAYEPKSLEDQVKITIAEITTQEDENVTPNAHLVHDLGADSLDEMEIIMRHEEVFGIEIPDDDVEKLQTVQHHVDYLRKRGADKWQTKKD